ncbi:MAG TPA: class I SAM-dependent methyltransferase [Terriglobia bacterium]|nr:class I SAM-dependent methyltransferase [Terriglobia bacterium]
MIKFIKNTVKQTPPIRGIFEERDQLKAQLAGINREMAILSERLQQLTMERDELNAQLRRLDCQYSECSLEVARVMRERDDLMRNLHQILREHYLLDPEKYPNLEYFLPGHFYSPIPDLDEVKKYEHRIFHDPVNIQGVDLNLEGQLELIRQFEALWREFPYRSVKPGLRYSLDNPIFSVGDACFLYAMIRHLRPKRVIELGSGFSSCLMLDINDLFLNGQATVTLIDPHPEYLRSMLTEKDAQKVEIVSQRVQEVGLETFSLLESGDILLVDSSHVCKVGSDVNYIFFEILPALQAGVYVYIHDIFFPFEYPTEWVYGGRAWNEAYLLRAFLQYNRSFRVVLFNAQVAKLGVQELQKEMPLCLDGTGGIWLRKLGAAAEGHLFS